jgi:hypothetical protein
MPLANAHNLLGEAEGADSLEAGMAGRFSKLAMHGQAKSGESNQLRR